MSRAGQTSLWLLLVSSTLVAAGQEKSQPQNGTQPVKRAESRPEEGRFKVGDAAPDFTLSSLDGKKTVRLSSFQGKRPVALIFGSYT